MYHGIPNVSKQQGRYCFCGESLERQIVSLKRHFDLIHPRDVLRKRSIKDRKAVVITFDDGLRNNAAVAGPILARHNVPALFFVSTRHVGNEGVLWFSYLIALEQCFPGSELTFRDERYDMSPGGRVAAVKRLKDNLLALQPHPAAMYSAIANELPPLESFVTRKELDDWFAGMTEEQVGELAANDLFVVGCHTTDHPFLTQCTPEEELRQIQESKESLQRMTGKPVTTVSYPTGDYNDRTIAVCRQLGFESGYAVTPQLGTLPTFEIPRSGIYQAPEEVVLFKAMWARRRTNRG